MALLEFKNLDFRYAGSEADVLADINLSIEDGEIVLITGASGSGKTTLLKHMVSSMMPCGQRKGEINIADGLFVGYVGQNPDDQIVTDKVWHELAFGLENMGLPSDEIRRRSAETAAYFGISGWYHRETDKLSGGQKQILNLAAVMAMKPAVLVLDEPTSQLDPIAAGHFLDTVFKLNRELGITVVMSEHCTEYIFSRADKVVMLQEGRILQAGKPENVAKRLSDKESRLWLPAAAQIALEMYSKDARTDFDMCVETAQTGLDMRSEAVQTDSDMCAEAAHQFIPFTIRDGRRWIKQRIKDQNGAAVNNGSSENVSEAKAFTTVAAKNVTFRYSRYDENVLDNLSFEAYRGEILALLGGNGSGKTTLLKLIAGVRKCVGGSIKCIGRTALLAQNPIAMFTEISVEEELAEIMTDKDNTWAKDLSREKKLEKIEEMLDYIELKNVRTNNPLDISGGQQQKLALAKALLLRPDILMLDEPTKGIDPVFKKELGGLLKRLASEGKTIILVSHDLEFCGQYANRCGLLFDGQLVSLSDTKQFFTGNSYYTTAAGRLTEGILEGCVTCDDVVELLHVAGAPI